MSTDRSLFLSVAFLTGFGSCFLFLGSNPLFVPPGPICCSPARTKVTKKGRSTKQADYERTQRLQVRVRTHSSLLICFAFFAVPVFTAAFQAQQLPQAPCFAEASQVQRGGSSAGLSTSLKSYKSYHKRMREMSMLVSRMNDVLVTITAHILLLHSYIIVFLHYYSLPSEPA